jgi:hypothetical protein
MQNFYINQNSTLPKLRVELINDGRFDFLKSYNFENAIQNADVTFSMKDCENRFRIAHAPATIVAVCPSCCEERYIIEYAWKERDTKIKGEFTGTFEISFKGDLYENGKSYDAGKLIMPIYETLAIFIQ